MNDALIYKTLYHLLLARGYEEGAAKELITDLHAQVNKEHIHKTVRLKSKTLTT